MRPSLSRRTKDAAAETAKAGIETKTDEQAARIPEVTELASDVGSLKADLSDYDNFFQIELGDNLINPDTVLENTR